MTMPERRYEPAAPDADRRHRLADAERESRRQALVTLAVLIGGPLLLVGAGAREAGDWSGREQV